MTQIRLYNSKTRRKEEFTPLKKENVRMYVCGPTVYDRAHLGNARPVVVFDILFRLLREVFGAENVTYARNFTDIDDKINARSLATGRSISEITEETITWYLDDMRELSTLDPNLMPRATLYISQMIEMSNNLIKKGHAYVAEGHVLFDVDSCPDYGVLSGRAIEDMIAGSRVEIAPYKRNPLDFVLWKPSSGETPGWESPWGFGRPGWHIECSAMVQEHFGESFDIHGGGNDLIFPHHENEIAQSKCAHPGGSFAQFWIHNEMLQVEGKKMSKSLDNFFTVRDLLNDGIPGEVVRFVLLSTHYGKPMDWTQKKVRDATLTLRKWHALVENVSPALLDDVILQNVSNDLNTPGALARMHELAKSGSVELLLSAGQFLGLLSPDEHWWFPKEPDNTVKNKVESLLALRTKAKVNRDFLKADLIRSQLLDAGIEVVDQPGGLSRAVFSSVFDPEKLG
ncbi:cysteine--tRNA ligase [Planktomarina sp.]|jgi:cysteinyl-tRNA synthetase|nr:cysteine--tRNA ligase [Planktomarina sp.]MDB9924564.1 cysteine--tRNA ligase [Planktomarina sp.]|tara:strand:- start:5755 stop:7119 length:1365 start_codon:yes stop_codon:yes gene_type:complete